MAKEKIETLAVLDYLTLLPNRSGLYSFYSGLSIQEYVTAMFLDIDNFKRVNDTYGHQVGDELLKAVTKDLQEIVPDAYIARIRDFDHWTERKTRDTRSDRRDL